MLYNVTIKLCTAKLKELKILARLFLNQIIKLILFKAE
jgi:hypothetical protein